MSKMKKSVVLLILGLFIFTGCKKYHDRDDEEAYDYYRNFVHTCTEEFAIAPDNTLVRYNGPEKDEVIIPDKVLRIFHNAFQYTPNINNFVIPQNVDKIDDNGRVVANSVNIKVDENNEFYYDVDGVLFDKEKESLLVYPRKRHNEVYNIPNGVKLIEAEAFMDATIEEVTIGDDVEIIDQRAFKGSKIKKMTVPGNVKKLETGSFMDCEELEELVLEEGIKYIGDCAFHACVNLKSLEIPNTVTYIGGGIVNVCDNLEYIIIPESVRAFAGGIYMNSNWDGDGYIPPFELYVKKGSYAEQFAKDFGYQYKYYDFEKKCVIE